MPIFRAQKCLEERDFGWVLLYSIVRTKIKRGQWRLLKLTQAT